MLIKKDFTRQKNKRNWERIGVTNDTTRPFLDYFKKGFYIFTPPGYKKGETQVSVVESAIFPAVKTSEVPSEVNEAEWSVPTSLCPLKSVRKTAG